MATTILTVSIPQDLAQFLEEFPDLSPSKVLQQRLYEIKNEEGRLKERLKAYETRIFKITARLNNVLNWLNNNNVPIPNDVLA